VKRHAKKAKDIDGFFSLCGCTGTPWYTYTAKIKPSEMVRLIIAQLLDIIPEKLMPDSPT
jgi:hypothetical protein